MRQIILDDMVIGGGAAFVLVAGPCVIEDEETTRDTAIFLKDMTGRLKLPFIFKASYDKANRTSMNSYRGPGMAKGLRILSDIKKDLGIKILSDVHRFEEIGPASEILDVMQVPAFLCRQTDFVIEVARNAKAVNIKKGQFLAPWDVKNILLKASSTGNENILVTERGATFGYNNLVVDYRSLPLMREMGYPVIFDATHSVQLPGGMGTASGGQNEMVPHLSRAAVAVGVDGIFLEVHREPEHAKCDGPNSVRLDSLYNLLSTLMEIDGIVKGRKADKK
jgi:2-dehydro-3-deoxyphosphooctonate aldolase (KDO 8-P synthase)